MEFVTALPLLADLGGLAEKILSILAVALGLGLVIFFHELGHFAVAKWCNVNVERFSIGFGPILWSRKKGETEYALSAIPFGGYVKMLGQDDLDPSQLSTEEIARDPRSYSSKTVGQRMAIISAGVIMNIITGLMFFAIAFGIGVQQQTAKIGAVVPGSPAWKAGLQPGDTIERINDRRVESWMDIMRSVVLSSGTVSVHGRHEDGRAFDLAIDPDGGGTKRMIGVAPSESLMLAYSDDPDFVPAAEHTPAHRAKPPLAPRDVIREVGGVPVETPAQLREVLAERRGDPLEFVVERDQQPDDANGDERSGERISVTIDPRPFRTLGLWMEIGPVTAVRRDSPADRAGLQPGDKLLYVDGKEVGKAIDPLRLPDLLAERGGAPVELRVLRVEGSERKELDLSVVPTSAPGWTAPPSSPETPIELPAIGATVRLIPVVMHIVPDSPAAKAEIQEGDKIVRMRLIQPKKEGARTAPKPITVGPEKEPKRSWWRFWARADDSKPKPFYWGHAFWMTQQYPNATVELDVTSKRGESREVALEPAPADDWFIPDTRGIALFWETQTQRADNIGDAVGMGFTHTRNTTADIYLTLRSLFGGGISPTELHGPVGIAGAAYSMARQGFASLMLFLGFLSVNLAVLNFLPIPVLDGGHMVFLIWEGVTRKKPSERVLVAATYLGMAFVLSLMMFVLYLDIFYHR
ncbi:MAG: RIP metalloprotease RseP [Planctomycetaceae bacterium]